MLVSEDDLPAFSAACDVRIPTPGTTAEDFASRWSDTQVSLPAATIVPATEEDIIATIKYAAGKQLKVIPAGGTHGTAVPINEGCIYLDMAKFDDIDLDEDAETVTMGGGVLAGDVMQSLSARGFYTSVPSSNAVGMVGYCIGGGSSPFNGLKGLAIDNIIHIRIIVASGKVLELDPESSGEEGELFHVLCGAGFGFGVITSLTLRAWPIKELGMDEDRMWSRKLIVAPPAIDLAAELFEKLQHPEPELTATLLFMRAPPSAPRPGAPMVLLNVTYFGPFAAAERTAAVTFDSRYTSQAVVAATESMPISSINDMAAPLDRHGNYKTMYAAWCSHVSASAVVEAFGLWVRFGEASAEARAMSYVVFAAKSTEGMLENDLLGELFFPRAIRERSVFAQVTTWCTVESAEAAAREWAAEMLRIVEEPWKVVVAGEERVFGFAANLSKGMDLRTVWPASKLEAIRRVKSA